MSPRLLTIIIGVSLIVISLMFAGGDLFNSLFLFIFLGVIPGTDTRVPSWAMITLAVLSSALIIRWITNQPMYIGNLVEQERTARQLARKRVAHKISKKPAAKKKPAIRSVRRSYTAVKSASTRSS